MDTTPEYIKMCEKAGEIQYMDTKQQKASVFYAYEITPCVHTDGTVTEMKHECMLYYGLSGFRYDRHYHFDDYPGMFWQIDEGNTTKYLEQMTPIWLPRQDQLQEMVNDNIMRTVLQNGFCHILPYPTWELSGEQLWLTFVMHHKFNKTWTGEEWE